jgi:uncharacterized pyridoxal phosphate-containing UPF0001 family protein
VIPIKPLAIPINYKECRSRRQNDVHPAGRQDPTPYFNEMAALAKAHHLPILNQGMSGDYPAAIAAGATHVRVGTAIFGEH